MDKATFEQYVQLITDQVCAALRDKEAPALACAAEPACGRRLITEQDALALIAAGEAELVCGSNDMLTDLARERLARAGVRIVGK